MRRREFLWGAAAALLPALVSIRSAAAVDGQAGVWPAPLTDLHVHLDNSTLDLVLALSGERGVKFGIVEHAGTKENVYPKVLSNDEELNAYVEMLAGKPVQKGVPAGWHDGMGCFSKETLAKLDYIITDAMTMPDKAGKRMKLWEPTEDLGEVQAFMDRYVDWHVEIMTREPIDVFVNVSWLPAAFAGEYENLWTESRMTKVIETAKKYDIAIEISSGFELPKPRFLRVAREAGLKFAFGTNGRYPKMGLLDHSVKTALEVGLTPQDMFIPAANGQKAVQRRSY